MGSPLMQEYTAADETDFVAQLRTGDEQAYNALVRRYSGPLLSVAKKIVGDEESANDVVQDSFISFYNSIQHYRGSAKLFTYLYRIVTNRSIDVVRKRSRLRTLAARLTFHASGKTEGHEQNITVRLFIAELLARLPEDIRTALMMVEFEHMRYDEIAKQLDIPINTVRTRIFRAREKLLKELKKQGVAL